MITTFTNRTGTGASLSVLTTRRPAHRARRAAAPGGCTAAPDRPTARHCPRPPAAIFWSVRRPIDPWAACLNKLRSIMASRPEIRRETLSPACRVLPNRPHHHRHRPKCHPLRH